MIILNHDWQQTDEVVEKLMESLLLRYQIGLETSMKSSDFAFVVIKKLHWKCPKIRYESGSVIY